jgi:CRP-like cAMP-binding protein
VVVSDGSVRAFFDRLTPIQQAEAVRLGRVRRYRAQSVLFFEGDESHEVLIVRSGDIKVSITLEDHEVLLDVVTAGEVLGELSAIDGGPRSASAVTLTPAEVLAIRSEVFMAFLDEHPDIGLLLLRLLASRLRSASRRQVEYGALDAVGRVCRRLVELMDRYGRPADPGVVIVTPLTQRDIAGWAGLSREAVVKALHALRALGWVSTEGHAIRVLEESAVCARASISFD